MEVKMKGPRHTCHHCCYTFDEPIDTHCPRCEGKRAGRVELDYAEAGDVTHALELRINALSTARQTESNRSSTTKPKRRDHYIRNLTTQIMKLEGLITRFNNSI